MTTANKYEDCESCAFGGQDHAICDECDDADLWEPGFDDEMSSSKVTVIKFRKKVKMELLYKVAA